MAEAHTDTSFLQDTTPMPADIPDVPEVGATSGPLKSASYFIGARCLPYNDDFMLCKAESKGNGEIDCLKEGRRVTRCAISVLQDINKHCLEEFRLHWKCMEQNNHQFWGCRPAEQLLNKCVFDKLGLEKKIPGVASERQIHLQKNYSYKPNDEDFASVKTLAAAKSEGKI